MHKEVGEMKKLVIASALLAGAVNAMEQDNTGSPSLKVKLRIQPRLDAGEIFKSGGSYQRRSDFYIRRARLEASKKWKGVPFGKWVKTNITLEMDKGERDYDYKKGSKGFTAFSPGVLYAYGDWKITDEFSILLGKKKKPYSRVSLTSSSRQLIIERPVSTETAKKWLGDYYGNQIMIHGKIQEGILRYMVAVSDGSTIEKKNKTGGSTVTSRVNLGNFLGVRIEVSPPGFIEKKKDDTGIGEKNRGSVVSLGGSYAKNGSFDVDSTRGESATVTGADLFARLNVGPGVLSFLAEYVSMSYEKLGKRERGWFVQGGYLVNLGKPGKIEPAIRYEQVETGSNRETYFTAGFNHYIKSHKIKWAYNMLSLRKAGERTRTVHQIQAQIYF